MSRRTPSFSVRWEGQLHEPVTLSSPLDLVGNGEPVTLYLGWNSEPGTLSMEWREVKTTNLLLCQWTSGLRAVGAEIGIGRINDAKHAAELRELPGFDMA